jgi:hypothetical protein
MWSAGARGAQIAIMVYSVDQIVTSWWQEKQIKIVFDKVDSGRDLNFLDHDIQSIPVRQTLMSPIK